MPIFFNFKVSESVILSPERTYAMSIGDDGSSQIWEGGVAVQITGQTSVGAVAAAAVAQSPGALAQIPIIGPVLNTVLSQPLSFLKLFTGMDTKAMAPEEAALVSSIVTALGQQLNQAGAKTPAPATNTPGNPNAAKGLSGPQKVDK